ncbi:hypothetical protein HMI54_000251 [Coelomomyces lativittatus]|nr:hypothetical protein HMI56_000682 [Coelomomyces lativittatus]KAJ1512150.1 hypothetical protein HMI54_000251 [Coelomomyces lativittatus]
MEKELGIKLRGKDIGTPLPPRASKNKKESTSTSSASSTAPTPAPKSVLKKPKTEKGEK